MPAGGKAQDTDARRIDLPLGCASPQGANGPLAIHHWHRMHVASAMHAVLEHKRSHAKRAEPIGNIQPLIGHRQGAIAAARKNNDSGSCGTCSRWLHVQLRLILRLCSWSGGRSVFPQMNRREFGSGTSSAKQYGQNCECSATKMGNT